MLNTLLKFHLLWCFKNTTVSIFMTLNILYFLSPCCSCLSKRKESLWNKYMLPKFIQFKRKSNNKILTLQGSYQGLTITRMQLEQKSSGWPWVRQIPRSLSCPVLRKSALGRVGVGGVETSSGFLVDSTEPSMMLMNHRCSISKQRYFSE